MVLKRCNKLEQIKPERQIKKKKESEQLLHEELADVLDNV